MININLQNIKITTEIAELCGIITGDGHLSRYISKKRTDYRLDIAGNKTEEIEYFHFISSLFKKVFKIDLKFREEEEYSRLYLSSKKILEFFEGIGLIVGKKSRIARIPDIILQNNELSLHFLRGLADTDFSVNFRKGKKKINCYPRIVGSSASEKLLDDVSMILDKIQISYYRQKVFKKNNFGNFYYYRLEINGNKNFSKWMNHIGFSNPKHLTKILVWKKLGYCPPYTTIKERYAILKESKRTE
tara:strand:+ start:327 stop:1064 length:738 start_codon:yes stop_codon:yes gene_type:complete